MLLIFVLVFLLVMEGGDVLAHSPNSIDLNIPISVYGFPAGETSDNPEGLDEDAVLLSNSRKRSRAANACEVSDSVYQGSVGGDVKASGQVVRFRKLNRRRRPNVICRVESFGRICRSFDERRRKWVKQMGFGGLLHLVDMRLPRVLSYWLMTRIDPSSEMLNVGDKQFRLSSNQVRWILGIPKGNEPVPSSFPSEVSRKMAVDFENKFGVVCTNFDRAKGKYVTRKALAITPAVVDHLMSQFDVEEGDEFKTLFLMAALQLVLCPTQCSRFPKDLLPALSCATVTRSFDWCGFVLKRLMSSVSRFGRRFYRKGYAGGCSGCTLFLVIFYLDHLDRNPVCWGARPRIKVWDVTEMKKACIADQYNVDGDFGHAGVLDVAYGETHPRDARDKDVSSDSDC